MAAISWLLAVILGQTSGERIEELPSCGVGSVYAMLHLTGHGKTLAEIESSFRQVAPTADLHALSVAQIREVLARQGVPTTAVNVRQSRVDVVPVPAILFLLPRDANQIGHFVVLAGWNQDQAEIVDLTPAGLKWVYQVPRDQLVKSWSGKAVIVGEGVPLLYRDWECVGAAAVLGFLIARLALVCRSKLWKVV